MSFSDFGGPDLVWPHMVTPAASSIEAGDSVQLASTDRALDGTESGSPDVAWSSSDEGVATVDASGLVTGVAEGETTITATRREQDARATVEVAHSTEIYGITSAALWERVGTWSAKAAPNVLPAWRGFHVESASSIFAGATISWSAPFGASLSYSHWDGESWSNDIAFDGATFPEGRTLFSLRDMHGRGALVVALVTSSEGLYSYTGLLVSSDSGATWMYIDGPAVPLSGSFATSLFVAAADNIYVGYRFGFAAPGGAANPAGGGLTLARWNGATWTVSNATTDYDGYRVNVTTETQIAIYAYGAHVWCAAQNLPPYGAAIFHSDDYGATWTAEALTGTPATRSGVVLGVDGTSDADVWCVWGDVSGSGIPATEFARIFKRETDGTWTDKTPDAPWGTYTYVNWPAMCVTPTSVFATGVNGVPGSVFKYSKAMSSWTVDYSADGDHIGFIRALVEN